MRKCVFWAVLALAFINGCESTNPRFTQEEMARIPLVTKTGLPATTGGMALAIGGETITSKEIIEPLSEYLRPTARTTDLNQFKEKARPEVEQMLVTKISNILLYQDAKKKAGEQIDDALDKAAETEVHKFIAEHNGDYAQAEKELKDMGMDWKEYKEYQKKLLLTQSYLSQNLPQNKPITYSELMECYNDMKEKSFTTPAMIRFRLIDIEPAKVEPTDPNEDRTERAKKLADDVMNRLKAGEDFAELAKKYSTGLRHDDGGLWKPVQPNSLAKPYDTLATEAEKINAGQITEPIETPEHIFIMKLEEKQSKNVKPVEEVQKEVENKIHLERRKKAVSELTKKLLEKITLNEKENFIDYCVEQIYQINK